MHPVVVLHVNAVRALELRDQLLAHGLIQDRDFRWHYQQATYDNDGYTAVNPRQVRFDFTDPALATFFSLKWR